MELISLEMNRTILYRVKYNLKNKDDEYYSIDEHQDSCKFTLIVYLEKSREIRDEFWVGNNKVNENVWTNNEKTFKCLAWGTHPIKVKFLAEGKEIFFVSSVIRSSKHKQLLLHFFDSFL